VIVLFIPGSKLRQDLFCERVLQELSFETGHGLRYICNPFSLGEDHEGRAAGLQTFLELFQVIIGKAHVDPFGRRAPGGCACHGTDDPAAWPGEHADQAARDRPKHRPVSLTNVLFRSLI
jgi:hypothetical protein